MLEEPTQLYKETPMAVTKKDLEGLSGKQLKKLLEDAAALQAERREGRIQELRQKWSTEAEEEGFSIIEVLGIQKPDGRGRKAASGRSPAKPKYRLPDGSEWSGRGRIPIILREKLEGTKGWDAETGNFTDADAREEGLRPFLL